MSRNLHNTSKHSRSAAGKVIENALASETGSHSSPTTAITQSTLHRTPNVTVDHHTLLAEAAYRRAEQRGFDPGHELEDWLAAESELNQRLAGEGRAY